MKITMDRRSFFSTWGLKVGIVVIAALWLGLVAASWADAGEGGTPAFTGDRSPAGGAASAGAASSSDDEYNFNWLDPEKKIYVLQNRRYLKTNRLMFSAMAGTGLSNPYRTTYNFDPRAAFYLSEEWGFEVFYTLTANVANSTFNALSAVHNTLPVIREIRSQYGAELHWVPWYAKINVFNKVLYFDWYFAAGAGALQSALFNSTTDAGVTTASEVDQTNFAFFWGTGHIYHITDSLLVRLDFTSAVYNAQVFGTGGGTSWYSNLNVGAGVGWRL